VRLLTAGQLRFAHLKNESVDARTLAHLLRTGRLPRPKSRHASCRGARPVALPRDAHPDALGAQEPRRGDHGQAGRQATLQRHSAPGGLRFLEALELADSPRRRLDSVLALIADFTCEIEASTGEIDSRTGEEPYVEVLGQIRGVGPYASAATAAGAAGGRSPRRTRSCARQNVTWLFGRRQFERVPAGAAHAEVARCEHKTSYQVSRAFRAGAKAPRGARQARPGGGYRSMRPTTAAATSSPRSFPPGRASSNRRPLTAAC
jgi:hypothetical protein